MSLINMQNISFSYENEDVNILENFNLNINKGEFVLISGDNGSGKTTLFRILNGLLFPQSGLYFFKDTEISNAYLKKSTNSKLFHKDIGFLFQNPDVMLFNSTVYDEIAFGPRQMNENDKEIDKIVNDCIDMFELSHLKDKAPYHLSGGQKKRVALASVLSLNPEVIVFDEPFSGLDKKSIRFLSELLEELKKIGKTIIISTHDTEPIKQLIDKTIEL